VHKLNQTLHKELANCSPLLPTMPVQSLWNSLCCSKKEKFLLKISRTSLTWGPDTYLLAFGLLTGRPGHSPSVRLTLCYKQPSSTQARSAALREESQEPPGGFPRPRTEQTGKTDRQPPPTLATQAPERRTCSSWLLKVHRHNPVTLWCSSFDIYFELRLHSIWHPVI